MKLEDSKVLVTGGASGMGRAFVESFLAAGATVAACDMNEEGLASLKAEAGDAAGRLHTFTTNVADEGEVVALMDGAFEATGGLNVLVNNAGIFRDGLLVKTDRETGKVAKTMSLKAWQQVIDVDLTGPFLCTREFSSRVIDHGTAPAVVVNISSVSRHGNAGQSNYSAAKAGLVADTALWAKELSRYGIRFGAIAPGFVETPILQGMRPDALEMMLKGVPLRRVGKPAEIFQGVRFIVECDYFTGRCLDIDGGLTL